MSSMTITNPQVAQAPATNFTTSTTVATPGQLHSGAAFSPTYTASADKTAITFQKVGTLTNDCSLLVQISVNNGTVFERLVTLTNAELQTGIAKVIEFGYGTQFRFQFDPGTTTGAGNGILIRFKN